MRKKLIVIFLLGLMLTNGIPLTMGTPQRNISQMNTGEAEFNLALDIDANRHVSPHSYGEGVDASFLVTIRNTGQDESTECNVTVIITRLFINCSDPEEMQRTEWTEQPMDQNSGHGTNVGFGCPIRNGLFAIYKIQARIDTKDSNPEDNTDTFLFFVVWVGWWDRWIDIID